MSLVGILGETGDSSEFKANVKNCPVANDANSGRILSI